MGSNPISSTELTAKLVLDSSPLQALHRCGALSLLSGAYAEVWLPGAVEDETRRSHAELGDGRVPDLDRYPWMRIARFEDDQLAAAGAVVLKAYRATTRYRVGERQVDRPELEAVLLAARLGAFIVIEDNKGLLCARDANVVAIGTADVLCDLETRAHLADATVFAQAIRDTGYHTRDLAYLAGGFRRPHWKRPLGA